MGRLADGVFGNPHSISPTPAASTRRVERARASMLDYLSAASDE
jgi:selenocysteine lyase/cysteine desulfurase